MRTIRRSRRTRPEEGELSELMRSEYNAQGSAVKSCRISVPEIAQHLNVGRIAVYGMLEQGLIPGLRVGRRWIVTRWAFEEWERNCGTGFPRQSRGNV